jgi:hypothetical protein
LPFWHQLPKAHLATKNGNSYWSQPGLSASTCKKKNKPKKIYEKSIKKYDYVVHVIIYHHAKLKMQQIFAQGQEKRGIQFQLLRVTIIHLRPVICY